MRRHLIWISGGEGGTTAYLTRTAEARGALRNVGGALTLAQPARGPPNFGGARPIFIIFPAPGRPFPNTQLGNGDTELPKKKDKPLDPTERYGTRRAQKFGRPALESTTFWRAPPTSPRYFLRRAPLSQRPIGKGVRKYRTRKDAPRNSTGRQNFATPPRGPPYVGAPVRYFPIFLRRKPHSPKPNWECAEYETAEDKRHRGAPWGATGGSGRFRGTRKGVFAV